MNQFTVNKGSDLTFQFNWPDGAGGNMDLTGYVVDLYDVSDKIRSDSTAVLTDATTGLITVSIPWVDTIFAGTEQSFRVRITLGDTTTTTSQMKVIYQ